jgi:hypothetical protein
MSLPFIILLAYFAAAQTSEYVEAQLQPNFRLGWQFFGDEILFKISVSATQCDLHGWCGIGFGSDMDNVDCIAVVVSDKAYVWDQWCETTDTPPFDTDLGGTSDLTV